MALRHLGFVDLPPHAKAGGFDHAAVHEPSGRIYVAHTANDAIDVIDITARRYVRSIPDLPAVAGALVAEPDLVFTAGLLGATAAAIGIFLPVYVFTVVPAPWFSRNRDNAQLKAFVQGATAAATGALSGAVVVIALRAIYDIPTTIIALVSLAVLWHYKIPEPILVLAAAVVGLFVWPLMRSA